MANPTPNPAGDTVSAIFGNAFHDVAGGSGVAITAQTGTADGAWQIPRQRRQLVRVPDGIPPRAALLLSANDKIRFVPNKNFSGTVSLTAYAWDGTGDFTNTGGNPTANLTKTGTGGDTPLSGTR